MTNANHRDMSFILLNQKGPFAALETQTMNHPFSQKTKNWVRALKDNMLSTKYRALRSQIFEILRVHSFDEIQYLIQDGRDLTELSARAYQLFGHMFGIEGTHNEIISKIKEYTRIADSTINYVIVKQMLQRLMILKKSKSSISFDFRSH